MTKGIQKGLVALSIFLFLAAPQMVLAGGLASFLFLESGEPIRPSSEGFDEIPVDQIKSFSATVKQACDFDDSKICIPYALQIPAEMTEAQAISVSSLALSAWGSRPELNLDFLYQGLVTVDDYPDGLPYVYTEPDGDDDPVRVLDEFNQEVLEGPFFISFAPPAEIVFGETELSQVKYYMLPDLDSNQAEIKWAGIFINPAFNPFLDCEPSTQDCLNPIGSQSSSFSSVIVAEMGRVLGLSASTLPTSLMFPSQTPGQIKNYSSLKTDDLHRALEAYRSDNFDDAKGSLKGKLVDGRTGEPWYGGSILLIETDKILQFVETRSYSLIYASDISRKEGRFEFKNLPLGDYYLLVESVTGLDVSGPFIDDEFEWLARSESFIPEFYDGKDRESNLEASFSFSVQSYQFAAKLQVLEDQTTEPVEVITNQPIDDGLNFISASGANHEILSDLQPNLQSELIEEESSLDDERLRSKSSSGCSVRAGEGPGFLWVSFFVLLALVYQKIVGLRRRRTSNKR